MSPRVRRGTSSSPPPSADDERLTNLFRLRIRLTTSSVPEMCSVVDPADVGVALVLGLGQPGARVEPELAERPGVPAAGAPQRPVGRAHLRRGLLVVDVLELHEDAVARGEHAARDRLTAAAGADAQLDVGGRQPARVRPERPLGVDPDRILEQAVQLDLGLELQVGAVDLRRRTPGRAGPRPRRCPRRRRTMRAAGTGDHQQEQHPATHAPQDSGRTRAFSGAGRNPSPPCSLYWECRSSAAPSRSRRPPPRSRRHPPRPAR